jgi:hypothetical protein
MKLELDSISTPQLKAIKNVLQNGIVATSDIHFAAKGQLCNKSAPKGYPKDKSEYADPECYRYPIDTKARVMAAWRYVHQTDNKSILGSKFKSVESRIKGHAKSKFGLDLQTGESEVTNWEQAFLEYYDSETMGERCENIVLEEESEVKMDEKEMQALVEAEKVKTAAATTELDKVKKEKEDLVKEKETTSAQFTKTTKEFNDVMKEVEGLRKFKKDTEDAAAKAARIKTIKTKVEEAGVELDIDTDADKWLGFSDDQIDYTISLLKKGQKKTSESSIKVPPVKQNNDTEDARTIVSTGLKELRDSKNKR